MGVPNEFVKGQKIPYKNPFDGESEDSPAFFGCDCEINPSDFGYTLSPKAPLKSDECMIRATDYGELPYWARSLYISNEVK